MTRVLQFLANNRIAFSPASAFRRQRQRIFWKPVMTPPSPGRILDVGGWPRFWEKIKEDDMSLVDVTMPLCGGEQPSEEQIRGEFW